MINRDFISRLVFHPRVGGVIPTLPIEVEGVTLGCFAHSAGDAPLTLIYFHGNGELAGECAEQYTPWLESFGVRPVFVEYRGYGHSTGQPTLGGLLGDGAAVVAHLGLDPARTIAFGRSLGSLYAVELARRLPTLGGLILESGIANLMDLSPPSRLLGRFSSVLGRVAARLVPSLDQRVKLHGYRGPTLVLHAVDDSVVPVSHGRRLHDWAGGHKKLVLFEQGGHNAIRRDNLAAYSRELQIFLTNA